MGQGSSSRKRENRWMQLHHLHGVYIVWSSKKSWWSILRLLSIVVAKPTWLLEVVQFRRRKHVNLMRCAQKPVYNAVAIFHGGTLTEIKAWVCWLHHAVAICQLSLVCTFNTQIPGLTCQGLRVWISHWHWPPSQKSPVNLNDAVKQFISLLFNWFIVVVAVNVLANVIQSEIANFLWQCANFL